LITRSVSCDSVWRRDPAARRSTNSRNCVTSAAERPSEDRIRAGRHRTATALSPRAGTQALTRGRADAAGRRGDPSAEGPSSCGWRSGASTPARHGSPCARRSAGRRRCDTGYGRGSGFLEHARLRVGAIQDRLLRIVRRECGNLDARQHDSASVVLVERGVKLELSPSPRSVKVLAEATGVACDQAVGGSGSCWWTGSLLRRMISAPGKSRGTDDVLDLGARNA